MMRWVIDDGWMNIGEDSRQKSEKDCSWPANCNNTVLDILRSVTQSKKHLHTQDLSKDGLCTMCLSCSRIGIWGTVPSGSRSHLKLGAADTLIHRNLVLHATTLPRCGLTMTLGSQVDIHFAGIHHLPTPLENRCSAFFPYIFLMLFFNISTASSYGITAP